MESSSSREILAKLFEQLSEWRKTRKTKKRDPLKFKWSQFHLSVIQDYVLKLNITPDSAVLRAATLLNHEFTVEKVASFMHALHEVFVVPHLHQLFVWYYAPKKNGLIAAFIDMLLTLLHNTPGSVNSVVDRIFSLWEGLRFLLAVLRDESFIYNIEDLWAEFEEVANKAGRFVHVIFFSTEEHAIDESFFRTLVRRMDHLEARIIKLANLDKGITEGNKDRTPVAANSTSNFSSALFNLEDLLNRVNDTALVKDQIKTMYQKLKFLESSTKQPDTEYAAADVAYEATYLINTFLDGDGDSSHSHSRRYLSIRLSHVIYKINSIKSGIQGINKNVENDTVARFSQLSLQNKSSSDPIEVIDLQDKEMATSALEILSKLFEKLSEWRKMKKGDSHKFKWSEFHLSVIHGYVLKLNIALDSSLLKSAMLLNQEFTVEKVASFMHALHEVFVVPHHHQLFVRYPAPKKNGLIAAFMDMLLTLLHNTPGSVNLVVDRIASLYTGLRFLLAVLWDESFIYNIEDLWAEFEEVANKAGRFIHLIIFSTEEHAIEERFFRTLLRRMDHLEAKIIKLANFDKVITEGNNDRTPAAANSIFHFSSALSNLEGVLNRVDDTADVKEQIKTLHQKLKLMESSIKQPETEHAATDVAYEATYLINTFLDGNRDSPHSHSRRYLSIRLSHVIRKVNSIKSGIQGNKKNADNETVANKSSSDPEEVIDHQDKESKSSSREILSKLFEKLSEWRKMKKGDTHKFKWSEFHLSVIHGYVLKLNIAPDSTLVSLAALLNEVREDLAEHEEKVASFMHALHEFFAVPQQHQLFERDAAIKKNGVVTAFLDMLLRLLHNRTAPDNSMEIRIDSLRKRLRFLVAVLGDEPFITKVEDLWAEFEAVANKAGSAVHLIIFSTKPDPIGKCFFRTLRRCIDPLKANIIRLSNLEMSIAEVNINHRAAIVDSLFIVDSLLYDLEDILNQEDDTIADVKDQITSLRQELELLNTSIKNQEIEESKEYLVRIRDVAYEAEYLINYFLDGDGDGDCHKYLTIRLSHVIRKIKWFKSAIQGSKKNVDNGIPRFSRLSLQTKSSHDATVGEEVIGLEVKEGKILQYLDSEKQDRQIISIVGMPGLGKTTLARKFYHHPSLKHRFDKWSWCVVSQQFEMKSLLIDILGTLTDKLSKEEMLNIPEESLKQMIYHGLYKRRYLIIMDDIWSSDPWCDLNLYFPDNGNGSRILLTSRNKNVVPEESIIYELPPMSDEHCWQLLRKKVFQNEPCPPQLLKLGRQMAKNCRGLPLAVVVTAGILSSKDPQEESTWKEVEGNLASYVLSDESNSIMRIVELSYDNLPDHLKPCFLYFGAYRKRKQIAVGHLLRLWIAEGFVCREDRKRAESAAEIHLKELINRSLITVLKTSLEGRVKACCVHDLLHEFCMKRCEEDNLHTLVDKKYSILYEKHQRFCIRDFVSSPKLPLFGLHVRSILGCFPRSGFLNMKLLRTLVLQGVMCHEGLNEIKVLPNLRCLIIGYGSSPSKLEELKLASISSLINLEFLQVKSQFYLVCTPSEITKMVKLRHVTVDNEVRFGEESITLSQINILEFLSKVTIRELKDEQMLRCSPNLRQLKCKCFPLEEKDTGELLYPDFSFFTQLESLHVEAGLVRKVVDIHLPLNVKELTLFELYLPWEKISEIGRLQNLQFLRLQFCSSDGEVWETRDEEFQQLRWLTLKSFYDLKEWRIESSSHFPKLGWLVLDDCMHLHEIPIALSDMTTLEVVEIKGNFEETLVESVRQIEQQQQEDGEENPKFHVHNIAGTTSETASSFFFTLFS